LKISTNIQQTTKPVNKKHLFNDLFSRTIWVSRYQKGITILGFNKARDDRVLGWQWHQPNNLLNLHLASERQSLQPFNFYGLDAFPDNQPTVSKH